MKGNRKLFQYAFTVMQNHDQRKTMGTVTQKMCARPVTVREYPVAARGVARWCGRTGRPPALAAHWPGWVFFQRCTNYNLPSTLRDQPKWIVAHSHDVALWS